MVHQIEFMMVEPHGKKHYALHPRYLLPLIIFFGVRPEVSWNFTAASHCNHQSCWMPTTAIADFQHTDYSTEQKLHGLLSVLFAKLKSVLRSKNYGAESGCIDILKRETWRKVMV